jgi:vacuolar-type H+-ATPase subunit C/Vma6
MVIPMRYVLNKTEIASLCGATEEDFFEIVEDTYYGRRVGEVKNLTDLEIGLYRILRATAARLLSKGAPFHLGTIVGYLALKEMEVTNLKSIAEGKRHQLSEEEISENLVM